MNILTSPQFQELKTARELPSSRGAAAHVMKLAQKEEITVDEIVRIVKIDPALAARVIKAANNGPLRGQRPVLSIPDAVLVLGVRQVRQIALGFSLIPADAGTVRSFDYDEFWQRSLATAIAFSVIAMRLHTAPPEEAYVTGLLSQVGTLALATTYPQEYDAITARMQGADDKAVLALEREAFATDHNEVAAGLLTDWGMPRPLVEAVYHHEAPAAAGFADGSRTSTTTQALNFARALADCCITPTTQVDLRELARSLALTDDVYGGVLAEATAEWQRTRPMLVDLPIPGAQDVDTAGDAPLLARTQCAPSGLRLLVADDDPAIAAFLTRTLKAAGHEVFAAANGQQAFDLALRTTPHIIITDWVMPEMDGVSLCRALRQTALGRGMYVLVMTDSQDVGRLVQAFDAGADDFVLKPVSPKVLTARLRAAQRLLALHAEFERDRQEMRRIASELAIENRRYQQAALTDPLTGFPNRRFVLEKLQHEWATAMQNGRPFACLLVHVDHVDTVRDRAGADAADRVVKQTAQILRDTVRSHDVISRLDAETFLVVCPNTGAPGAQVCAERLRTSVEAGHVSVASDAAAITVSIGVAVWSRAFSSPEAVMKAAEAGVWAAQDRGSNRIVFIARPTAESDTPAASERYLPATAP